MKKGMFLFHRGEAFESEGTGRFAKEILRVGKWVHPLTGRDVVFDEKRVENLARNTERYLKNGNTIPFPNGHTTDVLANLGTWTGPFIKFGSKLVGVVEPKSPEALEGIKNGTLDGVSAFIEKNFEDPKGEKYDEVLTHVCATNYPVVTGSRKDFVALSRIADEKGLELWLPEALAMDSDGDCDDPMDLHSAHESITGEVKKASATFADKLKKKGADHEDTKKAAGDLRDATARLANHAAIMHRHVENMTSEYPYRQTSLDQDKVMTPAEAFEALAKETGAFDPIDAAVAFEQLSDPEAFAKVSAAVDKSTGKFKGGFDGCVLHMKNKGYSDDSAKAICGKIAQTAK